MGIVFSGMFAFGLVLFSRIDTDQHLSHILFGNMLGISLTELKQTLWIAGFTLLVVLLKRKDFMLYCFDQTMRGLSGYPLSFALRFTLLTGIDYRRVIAGSWRYSRHRHVDSAGYYRLYDLS